MPQNIQETPGPNGHDFSLWSQAAMFYLPYYLWSHLEDGLLESFGKDAKSAVLLKDEDK